MSDSHCSEPAHSISLSSPTRIAPGAMFVYALAVLFCLVAACLQPAHASSGSLATGLVYNPVSAACPSGHWLPGMTCVQATLQCANAPDLPFYYGSVMPASGKIQGVIVYFDGGPGEEPVQEGGEYDTLTYYVGQNYGVVQVEWSSPWESTYQALPPIPASIQNGACRPATLLDYVYKNIYPLAVSGNGTTIPPNAGAGMCAQGYSAGSAAVAYSLAYYGAVLDSVELIS